MNQKLRIASLQLKAFEKKGVALANTKNIIQSLVKQFPQQLQPQIVVLPECFNMLYVGSNFRKYAEDFSNNQSTTIQFLSDQAKTNNFKIVTSIAEYDSFKNQYYNTAIIIDEKGQMVSKYRKLHLFDIAMTQKFQMNEREWLSPGDLGVQTYKINENISIGLGICYDLRFSELSQLMLQQDPNVKLIIYPGSFNMYTGPLHWELLLRMRALDSQCYTIGCSQATYKANHTKDGRKFQYKMYYGNSMYVGPNGEIIKRLKDLPGILCHEFDFNQVDIIRQQIPVSKQKRNDIYQLKQQDL